MATKNPKNLPQAAETLKNNGKSSKIKNLLLKYVPSKPRILDEAREVASSIRNLCKHVPINVAKKVVVAHCSEWEVAISTKVVAAHLEEDPGKPWNSSLGAPKWDNQDNFAMVWTELEVPPRYDVVGDGEILEAALWGLDCHGAIVNGNFSPHKNSNLPARGTILLALWPGLKSTVWVVFGHFAGDHNGVPGLSAFDPLTVPSTGYLLNWNASSYSDCNLGSALVPVYVGHSLGSNVNLNLGSNLNHY